MQQSKTTATVGFGAATISGYAASILSTKYGVPLEVSAGIVAIFTWAGSKLVQIVERVTAKRAAKQ
jgi:hypothetical protein